jgi:eukaryotic-like serine/threonine-protein kinase
MKPERWREIEKLYNAALEIKPAERAAFLMDACVGNESLRTEVESLLAQEGPGSSFVEAPAMEKIARDVALDSPSMSAADKQPRKRAPWWMYVIAAAFLICAAVRFYAFYIQPEEPGFVVQPVLDKSGSVVGLLVQAVQPGSAAARAGLEPGDVPMDMDGLMKSIPYFRQADRAYRLEVKRKGESKIVFLTLRRLPLSYWRRSLLSFLMVVLYLILAGIVAFARPYDGAARWGALFFATSGISLLYTASVFWPVGLFHTVWLFPPSIAWLTLLLMQFCRSLSIPVQITFFSVFPRKLFRQPWIWILIWLPAVTLIRLISSEFPRGLWHSPTWWPSWAVFLIQILFFLGWCAIPIVLIANYLRLRDPNERRRVRVMVAGYVISLIATIPAAVITLFFGVFNFTEWLGRAIGMFGLPSTNLGFTLGCLTLMGPIAMTYAILRHRLFDIRVMIRQGLRYAVARGVLLSLVPVITVVMAGDLLIHRSQPLGEILSQRGLLYTVLAGGGFLLHIKRQVWLDALDRHFFRERYNAQRVLRAVVDEVRAAHNFERVAPRVEEQIEAALHPEFASILMRQPGADRYRVLASNKKSLPPIPADSKIIAMLRLLGKPLEISQSRTGWVRQLPQQEIKFLQQARIEWLFPISLVEGQTEALLALGPKRSEEPYSWEDQELLQGITSSLALLLEQSPQSELKGFEECPECGACYDTGSGKCRKEGANLTPLPFPRVLAHRYRFEQRLGEGGMGMVYESLDTELRRRVAVKLMRSELTSDSEAIARFKREAQAGASFTHPNVVTIYDFGIANDGRAFLVMELLKGSTLRRELNRHGRLPASRVSEILAGICAAVSAAHEQRLLHRDLKPENIVISNSEKMETVKILDFGIAKPMAGTETTRSGQTGPGVLLGTLKYMSPEELRGGKPAESWDVWALAVVTYEMVVGAHPFNGSTSLDVSNRILAARATPLAAYLSEVPTGWQHFFDHALALDVASRPASALQLYSDFGNKIGNPINATGTK